MLFATPELTPQLRASLNELDQLRQSLGIMEGRHLRWTGTLRRVIKATLVESSTGIEGFQVAPGEALALVSGTQQPDQEDENRMAIACYSHAMDHVSILARDPHFRWTDRVILDLHFDACSFQKEKAVGLWRQGAIGITGNDGTIVYRGPSASEVPGLMTELAEWLQYGDLEAHVAVRAAMAHLNLVSIHPFEDGNGRISRILQSLVLAQAGMVSAEFASIEECLGANTQSYYDALQEAHGDHYSAQQDVSNWVSFCIAAHLAQGKQRLAQIEKAGSRWACLEELAFARSWPDRMVIAMEQCLVGGSDRTQYASEADISMSTASSDLRRLLDAGLIEQRGAGRNTNYFATRLLEDAVAESG